MRSILVAAVLFVLAAASAGCKGGGCSNDNDCKGDRVCSDGECVEPPMKLPSGPTSGAALMPDPTPAAAAQPAVSMVVSVPPGTNNGRVRSAPSMDATLLREVPNGTRVEALETRDRWVRVRVEGVEGWMHRDILVQPGAVAPRTAGASVGRTSRQGNVVRFTCAEGGTGVFGGQCLCGGTLPVANPCPGKHKLTQDGDACLFACEDTPKLTCGACEADCLTKADSLRKSDPVHAQDLAAMVCNPNYGCAAADPSRCKSYGFPPRE